MNGRFGNTSSKSFLAFAITLFLLATYAVFHTLFRLRIILHSRRPKANHRRGEKTHLLIVLGSGGHSAEMLAMLERAVRDEDETSRLRWSDFSYRTWVIGSGDQISAKRAEEFESMVQSLQRGPEDSSKKDRNPAFRIATVPRAREIHQPLYTAPVSCLRCLLACWSILLPPSRPFGVDFPDLILCNGPATATMLVFTSMVLRFFNVRECNAMGKMRTIYVESWARVKRLSLSGRLMLWVADRFFVQWPQLLEKTGKKGEFIGVLV